MSAEPLRLVPDDETMRAICIDCKERWRIPVSCETWRTIRCPACGSKNWVDINLEPIRPEMPKVAPLNVDLPMIARGLAMRFAQKTADIRRALDILRQIEEAASDAIEMLPPKERTEIEEILAGHALTLGDFAANSLSHKRLK